MEQGRSFTFKYAICTLTGPTDATPSHLASRDWAQKSRVMGLFSIRSSWATSTVLFIVGVIFTHTRCFYTVGSERAVMQIRTSTGKEIFCSAREFTAPAGTVCIPAFVSPYHLFERFPFHCFRSREQREPHRTAYALAHSSFPNTSIKTEQP